MLLRVQSAIQQTPLRRNLRKVLTQPDVMVRTFDLDKGGWERLAGINVDCLVVDRALVPEPAEQSILMLRQLPEAPAIVVLSPWEDAEERACLLAAGCDAVLNSTLPPQTVAETLLVLLGRVGARAAEGLAHLGLGAQPRLTDFVSHSPAMRAFMGVVMRVANSEASLLIQGETGVGKERLARAIHAESTHATGPFIAINCGALPETLLESELFGHGQGAFTGATRGRRGCFELAHRGTIFLDEISEMPLHLQVKLLRVLQDFEIQPVGSEKSIKISVRVMAATNRNLEEEVRQGRFRQDLFYRLSVVSLTIPPLRERREDIPTLAQSYIGFLRPRIGAGAYAISPEAMNALCDYAWPGNVRELINVMERAMLLCDAGEITVDDLPESIGRPRVGIGVPRAADRGTPVGTQCSDALCEGTWRQVRERVLDTKEHEYLVCLLTATRGRIGQTAARAGMQPRSLFQKMKKHGLRKEDFRR